MTSSRSLYEDWSARRAALAAEDRSDSASHTIAKVLDFLLKRYRDTPEASEPVHTLSRRELCVRERTIVIHAHLGRSEGRTVQSSGAAVRRVQGVLERMHAPLASVATELPVVISGPSAAALKAGWRRERRLRLLLGDRTERLEGLWFIWLERDLHDVGLMCDLLEVPLPDDEAPDERAIMLWLLESLSGIESVEVGGLYLSWRMRRAQLLGTWGAGPDTPEVHELLGKLLDRFRGAEEARCPTQAPRLTRWKTPNRDDIIRAYTASPVKPLPVAQSYETWRGRLAEQGLTLATAPADERHYWANDARLQLLAPAESDRVGALAILAAVGDLHDVGLMCDLLALEGQHPWERAAMLVVLRSRAADPNTSHSRRSAP